MDIATVNCSSCGAPIKVPSDLERFNCAYCGAALVVQRGEGYVALKLAEQVGKTIQEVGQQTQSTIREGAQVTQVELKRLQIGQEISALQIRLSSVQAEIRMLERQKADRKIKKQLKALRTEQDALANRIKNLQVGFAAYPSAQNLARSGSSDRTDGGYATRASDKPSAQHMAQSSSSAAGRLADAYVPGATTRKAKFWSSPSGRGCLTSIVLMVVVTVLCAMPARALDQLIFDIPMDASSSSGRADGPFFNAAVVVAMVAMLLGFVMGFIPRAAIWRSMRNWVRVNIFRKPASAQQDTSQSDGAGSTDTTD